MVNLDFLHLALKCIKIKIISMLQQDKVPYTEFSAHPLFKNLCRTLSFSYLPILTYF